MGPFIIPFVKVWLLFFIVGTIFGAVNGWFNAHATFYGADQSPFSLGGACGYDNTLHAGFGANTAALSGALFRDGEACGACYQLRCDYRADPKWCLRRASVTITATNFCIVPVLYRRVPCKRRGGVRFTLKGQSSFNMVMITNVGGSGNVKAAWIRGSRTSTWLPMNRNWGANWQSSIDLRNQRLSFKLTLVDGKTLEFLNVVPSTWKFGQTFASTRQFF
ncbi:hypothetical protein ES332_D01G070100v1 [Gossypium tomentosum]|uniref:Expansin n=1 Tax=Gossypium tomentosum TaxID=34277 RepID=A0A5D2M651_GOSTO|nr:hypothetical protein ES332_D01G070100v1 [Gossypium tomentosum]